MKAENPPPSYGQNTTTTTTGNNGLPSYDSLFGKAQKMKEESNGAVDFFKKLVAVILGSIGCSIVIGMFLAIPIAMIVIGSIYVDDCPEEKMIPIWLLVAGVVGLVRNVISTCCRCCCNKKKDDDAEGGQQGEGEEEQQEGMAGKLCKAFDSLLGVFSGAWFIAGNVWVYRSKGDISSDSNAVNYCHPTVYWFSFWFITSTYILLGVLLLTCCICCICFCCCLGKSKNKESD
ncbi:transmembrane protein 272-like isoform X2 [Babylonia areolata]